MGGASYTAICTSPGVSSHVGSVSLLEDRLRLQDSPPVNPDDTVVAFAAITRARAAEAAERLADLKALVIELVDDRRLRVGVLGVGAAVELSALLVESLRPL